MNRKYSNRQIAQMQKIYGQTHSLTATAKICECSVGTVQRYRDRQKWVTPKQLKELSQSGPAPTLTPDIATRLAIGWRMHYEDEKLCHIVGITYQQLRGWLNRNTQVTLIFNVTGEDGIERKRSETIGLRTLREREWAGVAYTYVQRILRNIKNMEDSKDFRGADFDLRWLLSKLEAAIYGDPEKNLNVNVGVQTNFVPIDSLGLDINTRKQILSKVREQKELQENDDESTT